MRILLVLDRVSVDADRTSIWMARLFFRVSQ